VRVTFVGVRTLTIRDMEKQGRAEMAGRDHFMDVMEEALLSNRGTS
jgi:hypothetical protein